MAQPRPAPRYYVPSNRIGAQLLWAFPVVGGGLAAALGLAYAFVSMLIVQVFESRPAFIIATPMFGFTLALAGRAVAYVGQVRRDSLRLPLALAVGALGLYASWQFYVNLLADQGVLTFGSPLQLGRAMAKLASDQGLALTLCWLLEAATIFGMIVFLQSEDDDPPTPFCEKCDSWTEQAFALELADVVAQDAAEHLKRGEAAALAKLLRRRPGEREYAVVRVYHCPCRASRYVCVHHAKFEPGKSAGVEYRRALPGSAPSLTFDPGDPDSTHYTPVLVNLAIDEETEEQLAALKR